MNRRELLRAGAAIGLAGAGGIAALPGRLFAGQQTPAAEPVAAPPAAGPRLAGPLQLNWNENPLGLAPTARQAALDALASAHRYSDAARDQLIEALAARHGLEPDHIVLGTGSTEILQMIIQAGSSADSALILASPTFEAVSRYQRPHAYTTQRVPLDSRMAHDIQRMRERTRDLGRPAVVYICNPNNPTATLTPGSELDAWIEEAPETVLFAIDEAYYEYVEKTGFRSALRWVRRRPNVVVTRTFSKIYGMAGMRLGYAAAHPETASRLREFMALDNANGPALAAAHASLEDGGLIARRRASNTKARKIVTDCLDQLGLDHLPSQANFLMHRVPGEVETYIRRMREHGVRVGRPFPPMLGYNRLSMGLPEEMERFTEVLRKFRINGWV